MRKHNVRLTTHDAMVETLHPDEFLEARKMLAKVLYVVAPATAEALAEPGIALTYEELQATNALTKLLVNIYGDNE